MSAKIQAVGLKLRVARDGLIYAATKPASWVLFVLGSLLASSFMLWSLNLDLVSYILFDAPISFADKVEFFSATYRDIFTTYESPQALGIIIFSVLFGINSALLWLVIRNKGFRNIPKKSGVGGMIAAILGGGCVACGTSLLAPLLATVGGVSSAFLRDFSLLLSWGGALLILFSIFQLAQLAASVKAYAKQQKQ